MPGKFRPRSLRPLETLPDSIPSGVKYSLGSLSNCLSLRKGDNLIGAIGASAKGPLMTSKVEDFHSETD